MGVPVIIYGRSGTGKSRSLLNFGEDEIYLINVMGKPLPFRKSFKYTSITAEPETIKKGLLKMPVHTAVIDDAGYLMTERFMQGHGGKQADQFKIYNDIADIMYEMMRLIQTQLPRDAIVYLMMHEDVSEYGDSKLRTLGKLLEQKVCLEGLATIVLHSVITPDGYRFKTQGSAQDVAKSPEEMFTDLLIDNDLKAVDTAIRDYYGMGGGGDGTA